MAAILQGVLGFSVDETEWATAESLDGLLF